jgi:hypothetical protein
MNTYETCVKMILDIGKQIQALNKQGYGVLYVTLDDITETKDGFVLNSKHVYSCDSRGYILIDAPFKRNEPYMAPELKSMHTIPSKVYHTCVYYSFKQLVLDFLEEKTPISIYPSKLFFLLERCTVNEPLNREFLYI